MYFKPILAPKLLEADQNGIWICLEIELNQQKQQKPTNRYLYLQLPFKTRGKKMHCFWQPSKNMNTILSFCWENSMLF